MSPSSDQPKRIGRYLLFGPIASGGMASVHLGRLIGEAGFSRTVAIKRLHPQLVEAPEIAASLLDEARIVSRIQHANVVPVLDLLSTDEEVFLVMEYVHGESLSRLLAAARARHEPAPPAVVASVVCGVLHGLHAAHEARSESGEPLGIVHRDVSPENVLVGVDGAARLLDFGIAKARGRLTTTRSGQLKGKIPYMAPEQILCDELTRRTDVYAAGIVFWEALTGRRLFQGDDEAALITAALEAPIVPPSEVGPHVPRELDALILRALERNSEGRHATARELAIAIEGAIALAPPRDVAEWVQWMAGDALARRAGRIALMETASAASAQPAAVEAREDDGPPSGSARHDGGSDVVTTTDVGVAPRGAPEGAVARPAAPAPPEARGQRSKLRLLVGALVAMLLGGGPAFVLLRPEHRPPPLDEAARTPIAPPGSSEPRASAVVPPPEPPSASISEAKAPPTSPEVVSAPVRAPAAAPARTGRAPSVDPRRCNPPYTVDSNGVRHLRPECI